MQMLAMELSIEVHQQTNVSKTSCEFPWDIMSPDQDWYDAPRFLNIMHEFLRHVSYFGQNLLTYKSNLQVERSENLCILNFYTILQQETILQQDIARIKETFKKKVHIVHISKYMHTSGSQIL